MDPRLDHLRRRGLGALLHAVGGALDIARGPHVRRGARLDRQIRAALALQGVVRVPKLYEMEVGHARRAAAAGWRPFQLPREEVETRDTAAPGPTGPVPIRLYRPAGARGALMWLHGGGFVIGSIRSYDRECRYLARRAGVLVAAVEYRLAPEHPYPAALHDAQAAFRWLAREANTLGLDPTRLALGGDSAGGNLTAATALALRDAAGPLPAWLVILYAGLEMASNTSSRREFGHGYLLDAPLMDWFHDHYVTSPNDLRDPFVSPLLAGEVAGLPPTHLVTAGFDPLQDDGFAFAERLRAAGVGVTHTHEAALIHGYFQLSGVVDGARAAIDRLVSATRAQLAGDRSRREVGPAR